MAHLDSITTALKLLADQTRLRILSVLSATELTVKELTDILSIGQSSVSTQLGQLKDAAIVNSRKQGQYVFYRLNARESGDALGTLVKHILDEVPGAEWYERDQRCLADCLKRRRESSLQFFGTQRAQNEVSPGQTWESLALGLIGLIHGQRVVDLGCGLGRLAGLFAAAGNRVVGVDNSPEQIQAACNLHKTLDESHLRFVLADAENTPLESGAFDLVIISQSLHHAARPEDVVAEAARLLGSGGQVLILDLLNHTQDWIQGRFADFWLGFDPADLVAWMSAAGFVEVRHQIATPDPNYPEIEPLLVIGRKT